MNEERRFNHSLYHLVYHWAAYVATLVLLLSLGALVAVTPQDSIRHPGYLRFANAAGGVASWFFLFRMRAFGDQVHAFIGGPQGQWFVKHPYNLLFGAAVTATVVIINWMLV